MKKRTTDLTLAIAYFRVSTDGQTNGLQAQRAAIERWASLHGVTSEPGTRTDSLAAPRSMSAPDSWTLSKISISDALESWLPSVVTGLHVTSW